MLDSDNDSFDGIFDAPIISRHVERIKSPHREEVRKPEEPKCWSSSSIPGTSKPLNAPSPSDQRKRKNRDGWGDESDGESWPQPALIEKTHDLEWDTMVLATDARVAADMDYIGKVIVTPNAEWIPEYPLVGEDGILKHEDGYWGGHEYTIWPQFYSQNFSHHACIPFFRDNVRDGSKWRRCTDDWSIHFYDPVERKDFIIESESYSVETGSYLGMFREELLANLERAFWTAAGMVSAVGGERNKEGVDADSAKVYQRCLRVYKATSQSLHSLRMTWREALSAWRDVQRTILELKGLHTFLKDVVPRITADRTFIEEVLPVRGAFTTQASTLSFLYRIGVPVWFICDRRQFKGKVFGCQPMIPWENYLDPDVMKFSGRQVVDGLDFRLDGHLRGISVNHFMGDNHINGLLDEIYKFQEGEVNLRKNFHPPSPTTPSQLKQESLPNTAASTGPITTVASQPSPKKKRDNQQGATKVHRPSREPKPKQKPNVNYARILHIPNSIDGSPDLPPYHPDVLECLKCIGPIPDDRTHPALYPLPPPFLLVHTNADKTTELYLNYIRIRPALIDMLTEARYFDRCVWRRMQDWRIILHGDYVKSTPLPPNTTSPFVKKIYDAMPESSASHSRVHEYELEDIPASKRRRVVDTATIKVALRAERHLEPFDKTKEQVWRGRAVSLDVIKADKTLRMEVQWELSELLFRYEFYALDYALFPRENMSGYNAGYRNGLIGQIFTHSSTGRTSSMKEGVVPDISKRVGDYWGEFLSMNSEHILALKAILRTWPGYPAQEPTPLEFKFLISFYVKTFVDQFKRMPTLHCIVPDSMKYVVS